MAGLLKQRLADCIDSDEQGQPRLTITLPDPSVLDQLAASLARVLSLRSSAE